VKRLLTVIITFIITILISGCNEAGSMRQIVQVSYSRATGPVLPEHQYSEEIIIKSDGVRITRSSKSINTIVNTGTWIIPVDLEKINALFNGLKNASCSDLIRNEPKDAPDGGLTKVYTVTYKNGKTCQIYLTPGTHYDNGDAFISPIQSFINELVLPDDAVSTISN